jgi:hypothetical protein
MMKLGRPLRRRFWAPLALTLAAGMGCASSQGHSVSVSTTATDAALRERQMASMSQEDVRRAEKSAKPVPGRQRAIQDRDARQRVVDQPRIP